MNAKNSGGVDPRAKAQAVPHGFRSTFRDWCAEQTPPQNGRDHALARTVSDKERQHTDAATCSKAPGDDAGVGGLVQAKAPNVGARRKPAMHSGSVVDLHARANPDSLEIPGSPEGAVRLSNQNGQRIGQDGHRQRGDPGSCRVVTADARARADRARRPGPRRRQASSNCSSAQSKALKPINATDSHLRGRRPSSEANLMALSERGIDAWICDNQ